MPSIIYQITNVVNFNCYISKTTKTAEQRFKRHCCNSKKGNTHLYRAMRKFGIDKFTVTILEETTPELLNEREQFWISEINPHYNMTSGGDGGDTSKSPNYKIGMSTRQTDPSKLASYGMLGKKQSDKFHTAIKKSNRCPVVCEGVEYSSVGDAQEAYPGINIRKRLDNPKFPQFYRMRERTRRYSKLESASTAT